MAYENVNLWFAKLENGDIVTIDEVDKDNKSEYFCPMCGSGLIPKAIKEDAQVTSHFAHIDKSKCSQEGMVHFWFKNKLLSKGDRFIVKTDIDNIYICDEILVEKSYTIGDKLYKPDVTIITECGSTVYFEMNYSNKKKIEDYIDIWMELGNPVVEVDVKELMNWNKGILPEFKALFYKGKCFNVKKNNPYYNTIGKYKEKIYRDNDCNDELKERIKKLDWFWIDVNKYTKREVDIDYMVDLIDIVEDQDREIIQEILNKPKCIDLLEKYVNKKVEDIYKIVSINAETKLGCEYEQYIEKSIGNHRYTPKTRFGNIRVKDISDNCFCSYDVVRYSKDYIIDACNTYIEKVILYNIIKENIDSYNTNADFINHTILENNIFKTYIDNLSIDKCKNYKIVLDVKKMNLNLRKLEYFDLNTFYITFKLNYRYDYNNVADEFYMEIKFNSDINNVCNLMIEKFNNYFKNLSPLNSIPKLDKLSDELQTRFKDYNVKIHGTVMFEDIYEIHVSINNSYLRNSYYISNKGIISNVGIMTTSRGKEMVLETNDISEIRKYLYRETNSNIMKEASSTCIECHSKFTLELGEIRFFNLKGFDRPSRCKPCREIRKANKIGGGIIG